MTQPPKRYRVAVLESCSYATWIEATSQEEALAKAEKMFLEDPDQFKVTEGGLDSIEITDERPIEPERGGGLSFWRAESP
jgi:hypothetical protein